MIRNRRIWFPENNVLRIGLWQKSGFERPVSASCAVFFHDDRLHFHDDRLRTEWRRQPGATKTVVMAMKTVFMEKECGNLLEYPPIVNQISLPYPVSFRIFDSPGVRLFLNVRIIGKRRINGKTFSVNIAGHLQVCNEKHMNNKQTVNPKMFVFLLEIEKMWVIVYFFLSLLQIPTYWWF